MSVCGNEFVVVRNVPLLEMFWSLHMLSIDVNITLKEYKKGYCLYLLDIDPYFSFNTKRRGHCRLVIKFAKALPENVTLLVYAIFPEVLSFDQSRSMMVR